MASAPLLDRHFLERLEQFTLQWQRSFPGLVGGHNPSRFAGHGLEFLDHRNFHHGDDLRAINWRAYMRLDRLFLKMFQVEPRVPVRLLLDCSASMTTGESLKFDFARRLVAALAYVALVRLDTLTILPFREALGEAQRCGGGRHRFAPISDCLTALQPDGVTDVQEVVRQFLARYPQRGLLIVVSDFLSDGDTVEALRYLAQRGHELLLIHVWADEDRTPPWRGDLQLVDAESGQLLDVSVDEKARTRYTAAFDAHASALAAVADQSGGRYVGLSTSVSLEDAVFDALARAQAIA